MQSDSSPERSGPWREALDAWAREEGSTRPLDHHALAALRLECSRGLARRDRRALAGLDAFISPRAAMLMRRVREAGVPGWAVQAIEFSVQAATIRQVRHRLDRLEPDTALEAMPQGREALRHFLDQERQGRTMDGPALQDMARALGLDDAPDRLDSLLRGLFEANFIEPVGKGGTSWWRLSRRGREAVAGTGPRKQPRPPGQAEVPPPAGHSHYREVPRSPALVFQRQVRKKAGLPEAA